ncbi:MAG: DUF3137 domain-containing protein, partial [Bacilli bacterium]|nr:DUF3137 domain-containing protein [Bacilli bacterium]
GIHMIYEMTKMMTVDEAETIEIENSDETKLVELSKNCTFGLALNICRFGIAFLISIVGNFIVLLGSGGFLIRILFSPVIHIGLTVLLFGLETKRWFVLYRKVQTKLRNNILTSVFGQYKVINEAITQYTTWVNKLVLPHGNRSKSKNNIVCNGFNIEQWVVKNVTRDSDGDTHITTYFEGYIIVRPVNINITRPVRIVTSNKNLGIEIADNFPTRQNTEIKVDLENIQFNNIFEVYAGNEQDAFYVINPYVTEQLLYLRNFCKDFQCVIEPQGIYLAVDAGSLPLSGVIMLQDGQTSKETDMFKNLSNINNIAKDIAVYLTGGVL